MRPRTLSASAVENYLGCPARYKLEYMGDRPPDEGGSDAGALGTACHTALEFYVAGGLYKDMAGAGSIDNLKRLWTTAYNTLFTTQARYEEGWTMIERWYRRCNYEYWEGREVLSTEQKLTFPLKTSIGIVPFTYIFDRLDRRADGSIEVVDYKTIMVPISADEIKHKIQCRAYAVAARIMHPEAKRVWVTLDQLRHESTGRAFTREECVTTYKYLHEVAERIIADDGREEKLNPFCRYCPRRATCRSLRFNKNIGGINAIGINEAVDVRAQVDWQIKALTQLSSDLDGVLLAAMQQQDSMDLEGADNVASATARRSRNVDPQVVADIIGEEMFGRYGKINMKEIDALMKGNEIDQIQKDELARSIRVGYGEPSIKIKQKET